MDEILTLDDLGNTSACAEKRQPRVISPKMIWKYLRMRGEELSVSRAMGVFVEIPPHARRRARVGGGITTTTGNTSACAEKRNSKITKVHIVWKYLRMRGEEGL
ncbi:hypothetical protein HMPREF0293_0487 [Corynebacterium glucuronolyticum ATCC 51866]|uniref:Uncharacterized protein n=1 Tax=Corynebacterium glucuronolyticum ATCC 51866 TaxID=548478 RepID=A0ABM9XS79_9CORY|nr:hypothetical protein HMPREF0293_0487 [Corynebacterium glucuronolyticum ATCC 51866]